MSGDGSRKRKMVPRMLTGPLSADQDADPPARPVSEMGICPWTKEELLTYLGEIDPLLAVDCARRPTHREYTPAWGVSKILRRILGYKQR